jgi:hypothetical protein
MIFENISQQLLYEREREREFTNIALIFYYLYLRFIVFALTSFQKKLGTSQWITYACIVNIVRTK